MAIILWAGLLGLLSIILAIQAGSARGKTGVSIGDGGDPDMLLAMRRHGNFTEYVPLALVLIALLEAAGVSAPTIHILGASLLTARVCHALGLRADMSRALLRGIGAGGTALLTVIVSIWCIVAYF